jgi:hypothetical protein
LPAVLLILLLVAAPAPGRNHFDRAVHLAYGLLLASAVADHRPPGVNPA